MRDDDRFDVIGCRITAVTQAQAMDRVEAAVRARQGGYVCFVNGHLAVAGHEDGALRAALNGSLMSLPDGRPVYLSGRLLGVSPLEAVPGPDFMAAMLDRRAEPPLRHFFLGGREEVLERLVAVVRSRYPTAVIAGAYSPPFRPMTEAEWVAALQQVRAARPDLVWVGLGAPKQEFFMHARAAALAPAVMLGVGAAFDFTAGTLARAPRWMRRCGLEWLFRLLAEPRRLWRRYAYTNAMFMVYLVRQRLGGR